MQKFVLKVLLKKKLLSSIYLKPCVENDILLIGSGAKNISTKYEVIFIKASIKKELILIK